MPSAATLDDFSWRNMTIFNPHQIISMIISNYFFDWVFNTMLPRFVKIIIHAWLISRGYERIFSSYYYFLGRRNNNDNTTWPQFWLNSNLCASLKDIYSIHDEISLVEKLGTSRIEPDNVTDFEYIIFRWIPLYIWCIYLLSIICISTDVQSKYEHGSNTVYILVYLNIWALAMSCDIYR